LSALTMRSDWFFLVLVTFWQIIYCSLQTKTNKKCVQWHRPMGWVDLWVG